ncbi:hypothetical protein ACFXKG_40375 [Streptomyces sp. NPDC059255]|uniref:hypothetical protein n=1 Tax=Streptomyces sp. NPDC059255 TaxID=3346793 RepID=UPI003677C087
MSYRYRCGTCRATSPALPGRRAAHAARDRHRDQVHGGLVPDGELLWPETGLTLPARRLLIGLGIGGTVMGVWNWVASHR